MTTIGKSNKTLIWDWPLRAFHWLLVLSLAGSWITAEAGLEWAQTHRLLGYFTLGLILFRIIWGALGPRHSRFTESITGPTSLWKSLSELLERSPSSYPGHSPIGGWASLALIALVGIQATSGLFISDDIFNSGPYNSVVGKDLASTLGWLHHTNFDILLIAVSAHVLVMAWYRLRKNQDLVLPMITGFKSMSSEHEIPGQKSLLAFFITLTVGILVFLMVELAPEPEYFF